MDTVNGTSIETTKLRTHWVSDTGQRYESRFFTSSEGCLARRDGLRPVLNLEEVRRFVELGLQLLPENDSVPEMIFKYGEEPGPVMYERRRPDPAVWYASLVLLGQGAGRDERTIIELARELTEDVPLYHAAWRGPFVASRESFPALPPIVAG